MPELPMKELAMTELPMTELFMTEYDGGSLLEAEEEIARESVLFK